MRQDGDDRHRHVGRAVTGMDRLFGGAASIGLRITLFGAVRVSFRGREIHLASRNARALLAVLALDQRTRFRDSISADLWPDHPESETGPALRQALWLLKTGVIGAGIDPPTLLDCDKERIGIRQDVAVDLDVARFEDFMFRRPPRVEEAINLYSGDLAEGISLECFARDRERLADLFEDALAEASERRLLGGDIDGARDAALRLLRRDPLREEAHVVLIEVYSLVGSRSQVSRQYRRLRGILASELNVEPLRETEDAYQIAIARAAAKSEVRAIWTRGSDAAGQHPGTGGRHRSSEDPVGSGFGGPDRTWRTRSHTLGVVRSPAAGTSPDR